ncbi:NnrS family protein [Aestuariispira ectoiniformans]|uniref:NnrS family protein n=1 Tax=Aestuariispira ectoiniformans TaxID=2775080 RepID=UPI00223C3443|nr:NnrS family protein [Aestuariispira ectoiniformans]
MHQAWLFSVDAMLSTLFSFGFRPFFLAVGIYAPLVLILWIAYIAFGLPVPLPEQAVLWHAHEMLFGVVVAALAGFILTAITNWTNAAPLKGRALMALFALWLAGRAAVFAFDALPFFLVATLELSFLPFLGLYVASVLIKAGNRRNLVFLGIFGGFFVVDALFLLAMAGYDLGGNWGRPQVLGLDIVLILIALVAGRIVPAFTRNWLQRKGRAIDIPVMTRLDKLAVLSLVLVLAVDMFSLSGPVALAVTGIAAVLHSIRVCRWQGHRSLSDSLLWVLHLGYVLLVLALWLKHLALWDDAIPEVAWIHAAGIGAAAVMILAVMSRAGLGHTGRALAAPLGMGLSYAAIGIATLARVSADFGFLDMYQTWLVVAAVGWISGFGIFLLRFGPMLIRPSCR